MAVALPRFKRACFVAKKDFKQHISSSNSLKASVRIFLFVLTLAPPVDKVIPLFLIVLLVSNSLILLSFNSHT